MTDSDHKTQRAVAQMLEVLDPEPGREGLVDTPQRVTKAFRTYAIQHHPEVSGERLEQWIADEPNAAAEAGRTNEAVREESQREFAGFERLGERLFRQMALMLMPVDRRFAGIAKDLMH